MQIHKINQAGIWTGESREAAGCPPGWVTSAAAPMAGQVFSGGAWLTLPEGYVAPAAAVVVPSVVTMRQARLALLSAGLLAGVDAAIASLEEPQKSQAVIAWEYSQTVQRQDGLVMLLAAGLSLTAEQIDQLFIQAAAL